MIQPARLFYRSSQTGAVAADLDFVVGQIIGSSIRRNRAVGITGLLLVVQGHYVQALEGAQGVTQQYISSKGA